MSSTGPRADTDTSARDLPQLTAPVFLADGGLETWLLFQRGVDLPEFAAFPLLDAAAGREHLDDYYAPYLRIAERYGVGILLDTPTWRANADWGLRVGYDRARLATANELAVEYVRELAAAHPRLDTVVNGVVGPRGDGYVVGETMTADEATSYHSLQSRAFARAGAEMVTAVTMTYVDEAVGVARSSRAAGLPVAIGFTTETDGRLPSGMPLGEAVEAVDDATGGEVAYYMVNCAHPSHFRDALIDARRDGADWLGRIKAVRANASRMSHSDLDEAEELDRGIPAQLAGDYAELRRILPDLRVVGGCCGTDHEHVEAIASSLAG